LISFETDRDTYKTSIKKAALKSHSKPAINILTER
jgi:hypothetical protein